MRKLLKYLKDYKRQCILGPLFKFTEALMELFIPLIMARIIDVGIKNRDTSYVYKMGGLLIVIGVAGLSFAVFAQYFAAQASQGFGTVLRNKLFSHIQSLSNAEIDKIGTPTLITRLTSDINQLQIGVAMTIRLFLRAPFLVVGATIMAFSIDWRLSLVFLVAAPIIALIIYSIMSRSVQFFKIIQKKLDRISLITRESLSGVRIIRAFSRQEDEAKRFRQTNEEMVETAVTAGKISALLNPLTTVVMNISIIFILWFGGKSVDSGRLSQGEIIALVNYMTQILLALIVVANLVVIYIKTATSINRVNEIFNLTSSVYDNIEHETIDEKASKIVFHNVSFSYGGENSLRNISFEIKKGETLGVIGGTGSGKSTLINLIPRLYDVKSGEILIDGIDVRNYPLEKLRGIIGVVPQKISLFSGTIRDNMRIANSNATDEEIIKALEIAQAREFVDKLSDGLDSYVQAKGRNLSGGQRQRLTIARALVSKPEILILDDSASALDYATDAKLRKAIYSQSGEMTVIIVSQRASSLKNADKIIVLENGESIGYGNHSELIESCEIYREICLTQFSPDEL